MFVSKCKFSDSYSFFNRITCVAQLTRPKVGHRNIVQGCADSMVFFAVSIK
jgi:hypothetical protein